jgi:glycyl-tRNA synthetase
MVGAGKEGKKDVTAELARRRGFIWQAFEIYGGTAGFYDYGPLGAMLKRRVEQKWREFYRREGFYEIETTTIAPRAIFESSGHVEGFTDPAVVCKRCKSVFRADESIHVGVQCPECGGELEPSGEFQLMFQTRIGVTKEDGDEQTVKKSEGYLRPETAQGMFINFQRLLKFNRDKLPFGIMQIGKAYRNEISPRQSLIRLREFTMAEVELFVDPAEKSTHPRFDAIKDRTIPFVPNEGEPLETTIGDAVSRGIIANEYLGYHIARVDEFLESIGLPRDQLHFRQHEKDEMAHYATDCWDAEFLSDKYGWMEIVGIADRGDYDLSAHAASLNVDLRVHTEAGKVVPHVIEPSFGLDRIIYALLESAYAEEQLEKETRRVLRFKSDIAPIHVAVFPLLNRDELKTKAQEVFEQLRTASFFVEYDTSGSIGKRYRRQDEIGTPYCVTVDYDTLEDDTVTVRERDSMKQVRVPIAELKGVLVAT